MFKLCAFDLLKVACEQCKRTPVVLPTCRFVARSQCYSSIVQDRIDAFLSQAETLTNIEALEAFENTPAIDVGEALLISAAVAEGECLMMTGDKRSLRSLHSTQSLGSICAAMKGRVVCLEQAVLAALGEVGLESTLSRVVPHLGMDTAIGAAFGAKDLAIEENVRRTLLAYIKDLRDDTGALLVPNF